MKIVHVVNHFMPDFGYQEHFLAKAMADLGHEVHVLTSNRAYPDHDVYKIFREHYKERVLATGMTERAGYKVHRLKALFEKNLQLILSGLFGKIREIDPDLVVMHNFSRYETIRLALYKRIFRPRWKLYVDDHSLFEFHHPKLYRRIYYWLLRRLYITFGLEKSIDLFLPVAEECGKFLKDVFGLPEEKMRVVPLGVDCEQFRFSADERARVRGELGVGEAQFLLAYVGKIVVERGLLDLLDWIAPLMREDGNLRLLIMGSGVDSLHGQELKNKASELGVSRGVIWRKSVPQKDLAAFYSAADAAIWPRQETIAAWEASASRLPILLSRNPISLERASGGNGINCGTPAEYQVAIRYLRDHPDKRTEMGKKGEEFVRASYGWPKLAQKFLS